MADQAWLQRLIDAWNDRDNAAVAQFFADDIVYSDLTLGERCEGIPAVLEYIDSISTSFSTDYRFTLSQVVCTEDTYAFEWTMTGTNDRADDGRGLPATGQQFAIPGVSIGRTRGDRIVENRDYWNLAGYLMQVGLMPTPATADA